MMGSRDFKRLLAAILPAFGLTLAMAWSIPAQAESGDLPNLELQPAKTSGSTITPLSDLLKTPETRQPIVTVKPYPASTQAQASPQAQAIDVQAASVKPVAQQADSGMKPLVMQSNAADTMDWEAPAVRTSLKNPAETAIQNVSTGTTTVAVPAVVPKAVSPLDLKQNLNRLGFSVRKNERGIQPVSYVPLQGIAIFPVIRHGNEKAFGDLPLVFAREYAQRLELKAPQTKIYNPVYAVDELRLRGFGHVYDQVMDDYRKAGRPEPTAIDYLVKEMGSHGAPISRVIFIEADLDMNTPDAPTGLGDRINGWLTDGVPKQMKAFVRSRVQVFDAETPNYAMVWGSSWTRPLKTTRFMNVTPSVYDDSDSQQAFAGLSREMSRELLWMTPREVYMAPQYETSVQGTVVNATTKENPFPNLSELKQPRSRVNEENQKAIQRILQRQNGLNP